MDEALLEELINYQKEKMLNFARQVYPYLTADDILQPNDFPKLENDPLFRYEEGVLSGLLMAKSAHLAAKVSC
jgi:hypothetical protein